MNNYPLWKRILWRVLRTLVVLCLGWLIKKFPGFEPLALALAGLLQAQDLLRVLLANWAVLASFVALVLLFWENLGKGLRSQVHISAVDTPTIKETPEWKVANFLTKLF